MEFKILKLGESKKNLLKTIIDNFNKLKDCRNIIVSEHLPSGSSDGDIWISFAPINTVYNSADLSYYAVSNINDYRTITEIPMINMAYLSYHLEPVSMESMFSKCISLTKIQLPHYPNQMKTSNCTNMRSMFYNCNALTELDFGSEFDPVKVENINSMFANCSSLTSIDLSDSSFSSVTDANMFCYNCTNLKIFNVKDFGDKLVNTNSMFSGCANLEKIEGIIDMKNVTTNYSEMFDGCNKLTGVKIKNPPIDTNWWQFAGLTSESQFVIV